MTLNTTTAAALNAVLTALQVIQASSDELPIWLKIVVAAGVAGLQSFLTQMAFKRTPDGDKLS